MERRGSSKALLFLRAGALSEIGKGRKGVLEAESGQEVKHDDAKA